MLFKFGQYYTRFALRKFPDGNFARARPRGFCLSRFALKQKHRSGLQILTRAKQFARLLPLKKHLFKGVFFKFGQYHTRFALRKFPDGNFARARPRGFCLSRFALKQKHRSGLQILTRAKQFARLLPLKKHLFKGVFFKFGQYRI